MPGGSHMGAALLQAVQKGDIPEAAVDGSARRILTAMYANGLFEPQHYAQWTNKSAQRADVTSATHSRLARELAAAGTVLLKNQGGVLPIDLRRVRSIAVIGLNGGPEATVHGGGSGAVGPAYVVSPFDAIVERFVRGAGAPPAQPQCTLGAPDTQIVGSAVKPAAMAPAASAASCCRQCFLREDCNFFSFAVQTPAVQTAADVRLAGGATVLANPLLSLRSGSPGGHSSAVLSTPLTPGAEVSGLSFTYRYITGYGDKKGKKQLGANFTVLVGGQAHAPPA